MKQLTVLERRIVEVLANGVKKRASEISQEVGEGILEPKDVSRVICNLRKKFVKGNENAVYIYLTKQGYSLEETPEHLKYEGMSRLKKGTSTILNGVHVYRRYKAIALNDFNNLRIAFIPSALKLIDTVKEIKEG